MACSWKLKSNTRIPASRFACSHDFLADLLGQSVQFEIETSTLYPIAAHQFSVFISELTQGVDISFTYPQSLISVEPVTIFSGQDKKSSDSIVIRTRSE
jgi:hypothetical protein